MSGRKCVPSYQDVDGFRLPRAFLPSAYRSCLKYKPREDDIFVMTFPKSGTNWTQQIVCLIQNKGLPLANQAEYHARTPLLEMNGSEGVERMQRPGCIKAHLPYHLTPMSPGAKYIYVVRNPKDALVSFYHHTRSPLYEFEDGEFDVYFDIFLNGENDFGDYFDNVLSWYDHRGDPNVLFLIYEELKRDTSGGVQKIAEFMGGDYSKWLEEDDNMLNNVLKYSSVEFMKTVFNEPLENFVGCPHKDSVSQDMPIGLEHVQKFLSEGSGRGGQKFNIVRKGIIGDWRNSFSEDQAKRIDAITEAKLNGTEMYSYWKNIKCI